MVHQNGEYSEQFKAEAVKMVAGVGIRKTASKLVLHESTLTSWMCDDGGNYCSECRISFKLDSHLKKHMKMHGRKPLRTLEEESVNGAIKRIFFNHVKLDSANSTGQEFGLGLSTTVQTNETDNARMKLHSKLVNMKWLNSRKSDMKIVLK